MWRLVLQVSPNVWNVLKFLLFEFIISVLIRGSYVELLRTVGSRNFNRSNRVSLVSTRLGRLTPYEFVWWENASPGQRLIIPKVLLVLLNAFLLSLTLMAEFGSGSQARTQTKTRDCYGQRSELLTRLPVVKLEQYLRLKSTIPQADCVHVNGTGRYLLPINLKGECKSAFKDEQTEAIQVRGCTTQSGKIMVTKCTNDTVHELLGTKAVGDAGWERVFPRMIIESVEYLHPETVRPIFSKVFERRLVRGVVRDAVVVYGKNRTLVKTEPRKMHCYMKHYELESKNKEWWTPRSCYFIHNGIEVLYGINHRYRGDVRRAQIKETTAIGLRVKRGHIVLVAPLRNQLIAHPMTDVGRPVHRGVLLYVAELLGLRREVSTISSNVRITVERDIVDDVIVRLYGFMENLGAYKYTYRTETDSQVANIDVWFLVPVLLLFFLALVQQLVSMQKRPPETLPCSLEEAVDPESVLRLGFGARCIERSSKTLTFMRLMHWKGSPTHSTEELIAMEREEYLALQQGHSP